MSLLLTLLFFFKINFIFCKMYLFQYLHSPQTIDNELVKESLKVGQVLLFVTGYWLHIDTIWSG